MPILERAAPAPGPDATAAAIEVIRAALAVPDPSYDGVADETAAAPPAHAEEVAPAPAPTAGHGPIRLRGRPVGPARGA
jgi:hypothetical protein